MFLFHFRNKLAFIKMFSLLKLSAGLLVVILVRQAGGPAGLQKGQNVQEVHSLHITLRAGYSPLLHTNATSRLSAQAVLFPTRTLTSGPVPWSFVTQTFS